MYINQLELMFDYPQCKQEIEDEYHFIM
jgi:hypothetical protein